MHNENKYPRKYELSGNSQYSTVNTDTHILISPHFMIDALLQLQTKHTSVPGYA